MIKPASYWAAHKSARSPEMLGRIGFALAGREGELTPPLTDAEALAVSIVKMDNEWMDERIEAQKERWAERKRAQRAKAKTADDVHAGPVDIHGVTDVPRCHGDIGDMHDVTIPPSIHSSLPPSLPSVPKGTERESIERDPSTHMPSEGDMRVYARQIAVPEWYLEEFLQDMRVRGFAYVNRGGSTVRVNARNFKAVLGSFWRQRRRDGVDGEGGADGAVETDLGRRTGEAIDEMMRRSREEAGA